ncbi:ATPase [Candidatus Kaiserbacteria bacterium]|nr:ATPase [Candidatus Kaiserbacteria bacterium]USN92110.1 MAG: ATPase [Candidatus Nomurabacteria bacterium]
MSFLITKADGDTEFFKVEKLRRSLRRAGANPTEINEIVDEVGANLYDGIRTQEIYSKAFSLLRNAKPPAAARYSLRRALFSLGPTGFPFEKFLARLFELDGYKCKTGLIIQGSCAPHEIDIATYKDDHSFVGEAKFHARPGIKSDLQVAMYSYARFLDLKNSRVCDESICEIKEFWLITNTKFTTTAQNYGRCVGLKMLSWDYPKNDNLHDRIQRTGIYPITVLQSLTASQAETLIARGMILCSDIAKNENALSLLHLPTGKQQELMKEVGEICGSR